MARKLALAAPQERREGGEKRDGRRGRSKCKGLYQYTTRMLRARARASAE